MEITVVNSAVEPAISQTAENNAYDPTRMILYHTSAGLIERLVNQGLLTRSDYKKAIELLNKRYNISLSSIFSENA